MAGRAALREMLGGEIEGSVGLGCPDNAGLPFGVYFFGYEWAVGLKDPLMCGFFRLQ